MKARLHPVAALALACSGVAEAAVRSGLPRWHYDETGRAMLMDVRSLQNALRAYARDHGRYPSRAEGLQALVSGGYLEALPTDPWGYRYLYDLDEQGRTTLTSRGADGAPGGTEEDADLVVRQEATP